MAEEKPSLHIDTDWKKQAQEEKKKLAEQEAARAAEKQPKAVTPAVVGMAGGGDVAAGTAPGRSGKGAKEMPAASFASLVQGIMTQVLYYLGDLSPRGAEPTVNLDMAKHHIDTLGVIEEKTNGNLSAEERKILDRAPYETRMRYVSVASQLLGP